jgi:ArsR family transcriptional regulator
MTYNDIFKALADETRLRCLVLLAREGNLCVCELCHATDLSQPKISRHLASLRNQGIVVDRRQGQWVFYEIDADLPEWVKDIVQTSSAGLRDDLPFATDIARLKKMKGRPQRCCAA